jgi:hypothetical protein
MRGAVIFLAAAFLAAPAAGQNSSESVVTIYRAAPGHQEALLRLIARQDEIYRAAGMPPAQLYVHESGDSWDFVTVAPRPTAAQDAAIAAAARRLGAPAGSRAALELRQHLAEHSDTVAIGPTTAAEVLRRLQQ